MGFDQRQTMRRARNLPLTDELLLLRDDKVDIVKVARERRHCRISVHAPAISPIRPATSAKTPSPAVPEMPA